MFSENDYTMEGNYRFTSKIERKYKNDIILHMVARKKQNFKDLPANFFSVFKFCPILH